MGPSVDGLLDVLFATQAEGDTHAKGERHGDAPRNCVRVIASPMKSATTNPRMMTNSPATNAGKYDTAVLIHSERMAIASTSAAPRIVSA